MQIQPNTTSVEAYIKSFPVKTQKLLRAMRAIIKSAAPTATEIIGYKMPAYKLNSTLVYFAGYENHIGFYPTALGIEKFQKEFGNYKSSKGAVQFPLDQPLPANLITKIVHFRVEYDIAKTGKRSNDFTTGLSAPAKRALESKGITTIKQLAAYTEKEILQLHGIGKTTIPKLKAALENEGLLFKK